MLPANATGGCTTISKVMIPAQIEKDVLIDAPVDVVWRVITEPEQIVRWFSDEADIDRKSTRLNSSRMSISYAVFCLKKKNIKPKISSPPTLYRRKPASS